MIVRLVKMTFRAEEADRFRQLFEGWQPRIRSFPGCLHVELLDDVAEPGLFFTHSEWTSEEDLEAYRHSALFAEVWPVVKPMFAAKAEAWTLHRVPEIHKHDRPAEDVPHA